MDLVNGRKYRIVSTIIPGVWNKPREMVYTFVVEEGDELIFSARPKAGTQGMKRSQIAEMYEVDQSTEIMLPRIWRGETRIL